MKANSKILITGSNGLLGYALKKQLENNKYKNILSPNSNKLNLLYLNKIRNYFQKNKPEYIFHLANKVYGIGGNAKSKFELLNENLIINSNLFQVCSEYKIGKILAIGSAAVYSSDLKTNIKENKIFFGEPHNSEYYYGLSKRIMLRQLEILNEQKKINYTYVVMNNLYGKNDNFDINKGHVVPSLIHKIYLAKKKNKDVYLWGTGKERRSFMYSEDASNALIKIMKKNIKIINVSSLSEYSIEDLAILIKKKLSMKKNIFWSNKNQGVKRRKLNTKLLSENIKFSEVFSLENGIEETINWFLKNYKKIRK